MVIGALQRAAGVALGQGSQDIGGDERGREERGCRSRHGCRAERWFREAVGRFEAIGSKQSTREVVQGTRRQSIEDLFLQTAHATVAKSNWT